MIVLFVYKIFRLKKQLFKQNASIFIILNAFKIGLPSIETVLFADLNFLNFMNINFNSDNIK